MLEAHERVKRLDWEPSYAERPRRYPTRYHIPAKTKDPFRHLLRDFLAMEAEKDDRAYGSLQDVLARTGAVNRGAPEFTEILKGVLPVLKDAEYYAMQLMMMLGQVVENPDLRQGYLAQELDECRHAQSQAWLNRYYARHYHDPAGFNVGNQVREWNPFLMAVRAAAANEMAHDPITSCVDLQVIVETAYTNPLFVAMTEISAASGDHVVPSLFLSIQSDEGRHMANGYATLSAVLSDDRNLAFLGEDLNEMFWRSHRAFDLLLATLFDYFRDPRSDSRPYRSYWDQWIWHDWGGSYIAKLEKFGLRPPPTLERARTDVAWLGHTGALFAYALWPLNFWRQAAVPPERFDWFEDNYPGWYSYFGPFWEDAAEWADPANATLALEALPEFPPLCRVCLLPCMLPRLDVAEIHVEEHGGRRHPFCSTVCLEIFRKDPGRYLAYQNFGERFNGWPLEDVIVELGLLRADGKTLIGQPHFAVERMWTLDDIRRVGYEIRYPFA
jgi:hypothetical protein